MQNLANQKLKDVVKALAEDEAAGKILKYSDK